MGEKENTDFGLVGAALERTKTYHNSNIVHKYDGVLVPDTQQSLSHFLKKHNSEMGIDEDTLDDDILLKYTAQKMDPTKHLDEFEDSTQIYIITDASGFDIGTYDVATGHFELSPDITEINKKMIEKCGASELSGTFENPNLKTVVEKLSKGESLVLVNEEQVKNERLKVAKSNLQTSGKEVEVEDSAQEKTEEEEKLAELPEGAKSLALKVRDEVGENIEIKEVLVVNSPTSISDELGGEENGIRENGGPVVMVRAASRGADKLNDDMYVFQDDSLLPVNEEHENRFDTLMNQYQGSGVIGELEDTQKEKIKDVIAELMEERNAEVERMKAENQDLDIYELKDKEVQINLKLLGNVQSYIRDSGYEPDEEIQAIVSNIQYDATPDRMDELDKAQEEVLEATGEVLETTGKVALGAFAGGAAIVAGKEAAEALIRRVENDERETEEDDELSRWDSSNPFSGPRRGF